MIYLRLIVYVNCSLVDHHLKADLSPLFDIELPYENEVVFAYKNKRLELITCFYYVNHCSVEMR